MPTLATCHCAAVRLTCEAAPVEVTECTCSICRRYGVLWAYYEPAQVRIEGGATEVYEWDDRVSSLRRLRLRHPLERQGPGGEPDGGRLMDLEVVAAARVRHLDGAVSERYLD